MTGCNRPYLCFELTVSQILHILCSDREHAHLVMSAASDAGFRESGISGNIEDSAQKSATPMVAVRSSGLAFDSLIAYADSTTADVKTMVTEDYLRALLGVANERFITNAQRKERFRVGLLEKLRNQRKRQFAGSRTDHGARNTRVRDCREPKINGTSNTDSYSADGDDEEMGLHLLTLQDAK